jgi:peptidoglycan hydrolase-like protein with peptidoglycan-binding domain
MEFAHWLQSRLTAHGYAPGMIDGVIGEQTIKAIKAFEAANRLPVDGKADEMVVKALRAPASALTPKQMTKLPDRNVPAPKFEPGKVVWPKQPLVHAYYGAVGTNQVQVDIPYDMALAWDPGTRLRKMTLHAKVAESAVRVLTRVAETYSAAERSALGLDLFGGSLNVRKMRGGSNYSMHSWGIAIDFDPQRNQLTWGTPKARLSHPDAVPFWEAWEEEGWLSLGRARNFDWMHVQAARL